MMTALRSSENAIPAAISNEWWAKGWAGWVSKKSFHMILPSPVLPTSNIQLVGCIACKPFRNISKLSRRDHSKMSPTMVVSRPASDSLSFKSGVAPSVSDHGGIRGLCFSVCCAQKTESESGISPFIFFRAARARPKPENGIQKIYDDVMRLRTELHKAVAHVAAVEVTQDADEEEFVARVSYLRSELDEARRLLSRQSTTLVQLYDRLRLLEAVLMQVRASYWLCDSGLSHFTTIHRIERLGLCLSRRVLRMRASPLQTGSFDFSLSISHPIAF